MCEVTHAAWAMRISICPGGGMCAQHLHTLTRLAQHSTTSSRVPTCLLHFQARGLIPPHCREEWSGRTAGVAVGCATQPRRHHPGRGVSQRSDVRAAERHGHHACRMRVRLAHYTVCGQAERTLRHMPIGGRMLDPAPARPAAGMGSRATLACAYASSTRRALRTHERV